MERRRDRVRRRGDEQGVPVRLRSGDLPGTDRPACTAAILDSDRLADLRGQLVNTMPRATSAMLPGANGTTAFNGRVGQSSAWALVTAAARLRASKSIECFGITGSSERRQPQLSLLRPMCRRQR